jgi:hypothetical protein
VDSVIRFQEVSKSLGTEVALDRFSLEEPAVAGFAAVDRHHGSSARHSAPRGCIPRDAVDFWDLAPILWVCPVSDASRPRS